MREKIPVWAYTNCTEAELFLNGKSLGRKKVEKYSHAEWSVEYQKGKLEVFGINGGKTVCSDKKITSGKPYALRLMQDNATSCANGADIAVITCFCVDENGIEAPTASPYVSFCTNGLGTVVGTGSSVSDHNPVNLSERRMYAGKITVAVRVENKKGTLKVFASADNLNDASLDIELNS